MAPMERLEEVEKASGSGHRLRIGGGRQGGVGPLSWGTPSL
jgi:hypothetical protein